MTRNRRHRPTLLLRTVMGMERVLPALPRLLALRAHRRMGADPRRFAERLGRASLPRPPGRVVWIHAASLGEVRAVRDLAQELAASTGSALLMTTATQSGAQAVPDSAIHQFVPLDTPRAVAGFLSHWRPDLGAFVESDLWPRLVLAASDRGVPLALLNARASRTRARAPRSMRALLSRLALATAQDLAVRDELLALGVPRVEAVGDLRAAAAPPGAQAEALAELSAAIGDRPVWAAVSTHPGDEAAVIRAQAAVRSVHPGLLLLWAPRHPARAEAIVSAAREELLRVLRRSQGRMPEPGTDIFLFDSLGETGLIYRLAPLTYLGGGFGAQNGHNPWEPASLGSAVLSGPRVANHRDGFLRLEAEGAARLLPDPAALGPAIASLLGSPDLAAMQRAARRIAEEGSAARRRTLALLRPLLAGEASGQ